MNSELNKCIREVEVKEGILVNVEELNEFLEECEGFMDKLVGRFEEFRGEYEEVGSILVDIVKEMKI